MSVGHLVVLCLPLVFLANTALAETGIGERVTFVLSNSESIRDQSTMR